MLKAENRSLEIKGKKNTLMIIFRKLLYFFKVRNQCLNFLKVYTGLETISCLLGTSFIFLDSYIDYLRHI